MEGGCEAGARGSRDVRHVRHARTIREWRHVKGAVQDQKDGGPSIGPSRKGRRHAKSALGHRIVCTGPFQEKEKEKEKDGIGCPRKRIEPSRGPSRK